MYGNLLKMSSGCIPVLKNRVLAAYSSIKDDEEIHNFFNELFKKYKKDCKGKNKLF